MHFALSDMIFCLDFSPFFFLLFPYRVFFIYLLILGGVLLTGASPYLKLVQEVTASHILDNLV